MSTQPENRSSCKPQSKRRTSKSRIVRLEERLERMEERLAELEFLAIQVDGEITFPADWREWHSRDR